MPVNQTRNHDRLKSAAGVAAFHALLGYGLITGLALEMPAALGDPLKVFDIPQSPPPPIEQVAPAPQAAPEPEGAAAPPNLESQAAPVVAPPPEVRLEVPPPVVAAPVPAQGNEASAGAAPVRGPGSGAGGEGTGLGSGRSGSGTGGGGGVRARLLRGELSRSDYPRALKRAGIGGRVSLRLAVGADGRVTGCTVTGSSGNAELDETNCRLIRERYHFEPARDASGRAIPDVINESHVWWTRPRRAWPF